MSDRQRVFGAGGRGSGVAPAGGAVGEWWAGPGPAHPDRTCGGGTGGAGPVVPAGAAGPGLLPPGAVGFPGCLHCRWRRQRRPQVCLECFETSWPGVGCIDERPLRCCSACGQALTQRSTCPTPWCTRRDRSWSVVFGVGSYTGGLRRAIVRYKFGGERWWAGVFALLLAAYLDRNAGWFDDFDLVVPTPAYLGPGARRSWDPVGEVFAGAAASLGPLWPVCPGAVTKTEETVAMCRSSGLRRRHAAATSLRRALQVPDPSVVAGRRVLVFDDVLTEGSTLREVAAVLRRAGAVEVAGVVLARAAWSGAGRSAPANLLGESPPGPGCAEEQTQRREDRREERGPRRAPLR